MDSMVLETGKYKTQATALACQHQAYPICSYSRTKKALIPTYPFCGFCSPPIHLFGWGPINHLAENPPNNTIILLLGSGMNFDGNNTFNP